ncbi:glucose-1-phosphate adenylyltransferase subunit GlgD [Candidatus Enterococcus mansonii]|uniref:Glucose-1-phosphate adenylyltransferase, GlgD subunit n=1 Tax=Candidatus Enterococcus mansonii TaxID=1834181 RepID=A0A242C5P8_9ENTE|nr:glucose-1-phosphate adenylyltransferase subunit GlgD [Enterococcus sp. 4G2_DIV0659]OTO05506.1 glucose-1-phosphate adenylyltransferase, GlgD subunit [Enterococcus sp. 4G2_DIV0659]
MKTNKMCAILGNVTRFQELLPLTENRPLDTLPFDCKYRLIDFPLSSIANANVHSIFMIFNEGETRSVFDHIGGGREWHLDSLQNRYFVYFYQDFIKEKAQGLPYYASIIDYLEKSESEYTVFMGSNMLCTIDLNAVLKTHQSHNNPITVVYKKMEDAHLSKEDALLQIDENGHVEEIYKKNPDSKEIRALNLSMNIYIIQTNWLIEQLSIGQQQDSPINLNEFFRERISDVQTTAHEYTGYLSNIIDVASYYQANMDMLDEKKFRALMYAKQKVYTKRRNEVPTYYSAESSVKNSQCATGCIIEGKLENSLVSRRTVIKKGAKIKDSILMSNAKVAENAVIEYAILDKNVIVDAGVRIVGTKGKPIVIQKNQIVSADVIREV